MSNSKVHMHHNFTLSINEEQLFAEAVLKKYGYAHGNVNKAIHEAIMDWIEKIRWCK